MSRTDGVSRLAPGAAVITGAGSGIGAATARVLAAEGVAVGVLDRDHDSAHAVAQEVGGLALVADVSDTAALDEALRHADERLGGLRYLVNNAGVGNLKAFEAYTDRELDLIWRVNVTGTYAAMRSAVPLMRACGGGSIVNVASFSGVRPTRGEAPYSAAKAAVIALSSAGALEFAPQVRVNAVSPGFIRTPLNEMVAADEDLRDTVEAGTPMRRLGSAVEVAELVTFLLSDRAAYLTGQNIVLDGGAGTASAQMDSVLTTMLGRFT